MFINKTAKIKGTWKGYRICIKYSLSNMYNCVIFKILMQDMVETGRKSTQTINQRDGLIKAKAG